MVKNNLNIPATYVHNVDGKKYRLDGTLLSINESTCTMKFKNRVISRIPTNEIYLNEGFIDTIKEKGNQAWESINGIVNVLRGFIIPISEKGKELWQFINTPVNLVGMTLPSSVKFAPAAITVEAAKVNGGRVRNNYTIEDIFEDSEIRESREGNTFWKRFIKEYIKPENESLTFSETYQLVNEKYYHPVLNEKKILNEAAIPSMENVKKNLYGVQLNTAQLVDRVKDHLITHLRSNVLGDSDKPILIWGAPGIGKTTILKQAAKMIQPEGYNMDMVVMACAALKYDDFTLPDSVRNMIGQKFAVEVPKTWLPVYNIDGLTPEQRKMTDDFYNAGAYKIFNYAHLENTVGTAINKETGKEENVNTFYRENNGGDAEEGGKQTLLDKILRRKRENNEKVFNGGILFFDEYGRLRPDVSNIMMNLMGDRKFGNMILASKWLCIGASNRLSDDLMAEDDDTLRSVFGIAKIDRFTMYTYVPTKEEWIEWARDVNASGEQNIDEMIVQFIQQAPEGVWYATLINGAFGNNPAIKTAIESGDIQAISDGLDDCEENLMMRTWTGRTWDEKINRKIKDQLKNNLFFNQPELYDSIFDTVERIKDVYHEGGKNPEHGIKYSVKNINTEKLGEALDKISDEDWLKWTAGKWQTFDRSQYLRKSDRLQFFLNWIGKVVLVDATGGEDTLPVTQWEKYTKVRRIFTDAQIASIWEKGKLTSARDVKDDDMYFATLGGYENMTKAARWKAEEHNIVDVFKSIADAYSFEKMKKDIAADMVSLKNAPTATKADVEKYRKKYEIALNNVETGEEMKACFLMDELEEEDQIQIATILKNSKSGQLLANAMNYVAKIAWQTKKDSNANEFKDMISWKLRDAIDKSSSDVKAYFADHKTTMQPALAIYNGLINRDLIAE